MIKLPFSKSFSEDVSIKGNNDIMLNLERIWVMSIALMIGQIVNYADLGFSRYPQWAEVIMFTVGFVVFTFFIKILKSKSINEKLARSLIVFFWVIFLLSMIPFIVSDIEAGHQPINAVITCFAFVCVPIFRGYTERRMLMLLGAVILFTGILAGATVPFYLKTLLVAIIGKMISSHTHYNYNRIIEKLSDETETDFLTGILNRRGGFERARADFSLCVRHKQIYVAYMIDIDYFKDYNDSFGHYMGDNALIAVAECISRTFARKSDIYFRYGGEEFAACISVDREETVVRLAENLRRNVESLMLKAGNTAISPYLTVSVGATAYIPGKTPDTISEIDLFEKADAALYKAKESGRNRTIYLKMR